jgi:hypothetical protein
MNWFKTGLAFLPLLLLILEIVFIDSFHSHSNFNPVTTQNDDLNQFENILHLSNLQPVGLKFFGFRHEVEFFIKDTAVIFSNNLSPLAQVTALQNILKTSNIRGKRLKFIDLSSTHPYATFENN